MGSLLPGPFTITALGAAWLALVLTAALAAFIPTAVGQCGRIGSGLSFDFASLPDPNLRAILQPVGTVHRHFFSYLETTLDVGAGLVRCQDLDRTQVRDLMFV